MASFLATEINGLLNHINLLLFTDSQMRVRYVDSKFCPYFERDNPSDESHCHVANWHLAMITEHIE